MRRAKKWSALSTTKCLLRGSRHCRTQRPDVGSRKGIASGEAYRCYGVKRNRKPHSIHVAKLQSHVNVLDPDRWTLGWYSFDSPDMEGFLVDPYQAKQQVLLFTFRDD